MLSNTLNFTYRRNLIELQKWYCILDLCPMHCFILTMKVISYELNNELRLRKWVILTECIISTPIVIKTKWPKLYCNQIDSFADDLKLCTGYQESKYVLPLLMVLHRKKTLLCILICIKFNWAIEFDMVFNTFRIFKQP